MSILGMLPLSDIKTEKKSYNVVNQIKLNLKIRADFFKSSSVQISPRLC